MRAVVLALACVSVVTACRFEVSYDGTSYACEDGVCPAGFACIAGECVLPGTEPDATTAADARIDAPPPPDASPPDAPLVSDAPPADAATCAGGEASIEDVETGHCYLYVAAAATWSAADQACTVLFGPLARLATIGGAAENALVSGLPGVGVVDVWTGATDAAVEGTFVWVTGEPFSFTNWRIGEPNDDGLAGEDCGVMEVDVGGTWDDRNCEQLYPFVCERP